jgi:hypothetical protein
MGAYSSDGAVGRVYARAVISWRRAVALTAALVAAGGLAACGGSTDEPPRTVVVTVAQAATATEAPPAPARERRARRARVDTGYSRCDANITMRTATTTCPFAQNVFYAYWTSGEAPSIEAYSPTTGNVYGLTCSVSVRLVTCRTPQSAVVRFSQAAVDAYSQDQADSYADGHDVGPPEPEPAPAEEPRPDPAAGCDPSYEGECLDPDSYDYDCEGGTGDGPDYTGPVRVVGDDHYGLDRDGNGVACDW